MSKRQRLIPTTLENLHNMADTNKTEVYFFRAECTQKHEFRIMMILHAEPAYQDQGW
jgi:hypothetical protein